MAKNNRSSPVKIDDKVTLKYLQILYQIISLSLCLIRASCICDIF